MSVLLFSLRNVPEDEAYEVRDLLASNEIDFYETTAGNWGISVPAIWLTNNEQYTQARQLLNAYQQQREITQRQRYIEQCKLGEQDTFVKNLHRHPTRSITYLLAAIAVLYISGKFIFVLNM